MNKLAFFLYLVFTVSWFLHLGDRIPLLGTIRFDLILIASILALIILAQEDTRDPQYHEQTSKKLNILIGYSILSIPFVQWPGSVLWFGLPNFIKAVIFYFFTIKLLSNVKRLKIFMGVFLLCQIFRVLEPLFLHLTQGYWGSRASMANWEFMDRLSGAPHDTVNPNGLAFIIDSIIPFLYFFSALSKINKVALLLLLPLMLYTLVLTGSRSGLIGLIVISSIIIYNSSNKVVLLGLSLLSAFVIFSFLTPVQKDRFLSIVDKNTENAITASGRLEGIKKDFKVALRRPFFGHGLGTSREANANFGGIDQRAHNLFAEIAQELGLVGVVLFLSYVKSIVTLIKKLESKREEWGYESIFLNQLWMALEVWFVMNFIFSFASYGLSSYEWYLFPGLLVVTSQLASVRHNQVNITTIRRNKSESRSWPSVASPS